MSSSVAVELPEGTMDRARDGSGFSLAPNTYTDARRWLAEKQRILSKSWIPVVRLSDLEQPGSFLALNLFGEPVAVIRGADGKVRALSNVCRHRAMAMLEGEGRADGILCPYHQWSYKLDGSLLVAPYMDKSADFDRAKCSLPQFAVEQWQGWVMVNLDPSATPIGASLNELDAKLPADLSDWVTTSVTHFRSPFNWKIIVENGSESYHNTGSHQNSINPLWPGGRSEPIMTNGEYCEVRHPIDAIAGTFTAYTVFPLMTFTVQEPDMSVLWYDLRINDLDDCDMYLRVLMPKDRAADAEEVSRMKETVAMIHQEDIDTCAKVQRGVQSQVASAGPLSHLEFPLRQFHSWMDARLQAVG